MVIRFVLIERTNNIVPITPGVRPHEVLVDDSLRIRITSSVEPINAPAFAIVSRREQLVDEPLVSIWPRVGDVAGNFLG